MSHIYVEIPDEHPGRCLNFRRQGHHTARCLDYDDVPHICTFPEPPRLSTTWSTSKLSWSPIHVPKPWVKPEEDTDDST